MSPPAVSHDYIHPSINLTTFPVKGSWVAGANPSCEAESTLNLHLAVVLFSLAFDSASSH